MKSAIALLFAAILICSCKSSPVKQSFSSADSLVIHFKNEKAGVITRTVQTAESKAINRVIEFIDGKETKPFDCGYDGKMFFYKKGERMQEVDFKITNDTCNHFAFKLNDKLISTKVSNEAVDFLNALEQGLPTYY